MDKPVSNNTDRRSFADEGPLPALVERLTERGIIRPEEAEDMLALLQAFSDDAPDHAPAARKPIAPARGNQTLTRPGKPRTPSGQSW